jgi:hypothetical protein
MQAGTGKRLLIPRTQHATSAQMIQKDDRKSLRARALWIIMLMRIVIIQVAKKACET